MKTFAIRQKRSVPAIRRSQPSRFGYRGPEVKAQQAEIHRILRSTGTQANPMADQITPLVQRQRQEGLKEEDLQMKTNPAVLQRQDIEDEEPLQGKHESAQRQGLEKEEEVLQGKLTSSETPVQFQGDVGEAENRTGMPRPLKAGLEALSGMDLSGVRVHYNASRPAQVNALAYTQGQDIHVGPGQEKHLAHEGWHAVQQMQGRVKPRYRRKTRRLMRMRA